MKKRKRIDWSRYLPVGMDREKEFKRLGIFHGGCTLISGIFLLNYFQNYLNLFLWNGEEYVIREGARMQPFSSLYEGCMVGFVVFALNMFFMAAAYYGSYYTPTKSIYVMRRLPSKWEMPRRVWTIPLLTILTCLVFAGILTLLYIAIYFILTPTVCLPNNPFR